MRTVFMIILGVVSIGLIVSIMLQSSKSEGLSSTFTGGNTDQLFGNKKAQGRDAILNKLTIILGIVFVILTIVLLVIK